MATFVMIPGAGGAAWYWHRVALDLRTRGHEVIAVDLPADDDGAGLERYVTTALEAIGDRTDLVVVAQSMGAYTASIVAERTACRLLVLVNPMIPRPGESAGEWWANTDQSAAMEAHAKRIGAEGLGMDDLETLFGHDVPAPVWAESAQHARDQSGTPFGDPWPLRAWPAIPTRVLLARQDRLFPLDFQRRQVRERLRIIPDEIDGGHLVALSRPDQVAARIEFFVASSGAGEAAALPKPLGHPSTPFQVAHGSFAS